MVTKQTAPLDGASKAAIIAAQANAEEAKRLEQAVAVETFREYGAIAAKGDSITTAMAFEWHALRAAGTFAEGEAELLYRPYAEAYNANKRSDSDGLAIGSDSYKAGLSTFATFGLANMVAMVAALGPIAWERQDLGADGKPVTVPVKGSLYDRLAAVRSAVPNKADTNGSAYSLYARLNRAVSDWLKADGANLVLAKLQDPEAREAFIAKIVMKDGGAGKSDVDIIQAAIDAIAKRGKKSAHGSELLKISAALIEARDEFIAHVKAVKGENDAFLLQRAVGSATVQ